MKRNLLPLEVGTNIVQGFKGKFIKEGVQLLTDPTYDGQKWVALANVLGSLCVIEVNIVIDVVPSGS